DHHGLTVGEFRIARKLARQPDRCFSADTCEFLLPRRRVGCVGVVIARRVVALEAAAVPELGHQQIKACGDDDLAFVGGGTPHTTIGVTVPGIPLEKFSNSTWATAS